MDPELRAAKVDARSEDHTAMFKASLQGNVALVAYDSVAAGAASQTNQRIANVHFGNAIYQILQGFRSKSDVLCWIRLNSCYVGAEFAIQLQSGI